MQDGSKRNLSEDIKTKIMKLTGKTKEDFFKWFKKNSKIKLHEYEKVEIVFKIQNEVYKNALIIDFFDSVGVYIGITNYSSYFRCWIGEKCINIFDTRTEATSEAIIKANDLYNQK